MSRQSWRCSSGKTSYIQEHKALYTLYCSFVWRYGATPTKATYTQYVQKSAIMIVNYVGYHEHINKKQIYFLVT